MTQRMAEPDMLGVLRALGYESLPAKHNQTRVTKAGISLFVGHPVEIWRWLHITGQFSHPTLFAANQDEFALIAEANRKLQEAAMDDEHDAGIESDCGEGYIPQHRATDGLLSSEAWL